MSTRRLQVRDALATLVATSTGLTVHKNLDFAIEDQLLPVGVVMSGNDAIDDELSDFDQDGITARFGVHILVARSTDPEAAADVFEALLQTALGADPTLGGVASLVRYRGGEWDFDLGDCAVRRLVFETTFMN